MCLEFRDFDFQQKKYRNAKMFHHSSIEAEIKAARQRQKLLKDAAKHGGPCRSVEYVEDFKDRLKGGELTTVVKNEIRYQKTELKVPGSLQLTKLTHLQ